MKRRYSFNKYLNIYDWSGITTINILSSSEARYNDKNYLLRFYYGLGSVLSISLELTLHNNPMMKVRPRDIYNLAMLTHIGLWS